MFNLLPITEDANVYMYLGYLKLFVTLTKYAPLAYWNYVRKSTEGFRVGAFFFDFAGASFSIAQEVIDNVDGSNNYISYQI